MITEKSKETLKCKLQWKLEFISLLKKVIQNEPLTSIEFEKVSTSFGGIRVITPTIVNAAATYLIKHREDVIKICLEIMHEEPQVDSSIIQEFNNALSEFLPLRTEAVRQNLQKLSTLDLKSVEQSIAEDILWQKSKLLKSYIDEITGIINKSERFIQPQYKEIVLEKVLSSLDLSLKNTDLRRVSFHGVKLDGADLTGATLQAEQLLRAKSVVNTKLDLALEAEFNTKRFEALSRRLESTRTQILTARRFIDNLDLSYLVKFRETDFTSKSESAVKEEVSRRLEHLSLEELRDLKLTLMSDSIINILPQQHRYSFRHLSDDQLRIATASKEEILQVLTQLLVHRNYYISAYLIGYCVDKKIYRLYNTIKDTNLIISDVEKITLTIDEEHKALLQAMLEEVKTLRKASSADEASIRFKYSIKNLGEYIAALQDPVDVFNGVGPADILKSILRIAKNAGQVVDLRKTDLTGISLKQSGYDVNKPDVVVLMTPEQERTQFTDTELQARYEQFFKYAETGDIIHIVTLLDSGYPVDALDFSGRTALMRACIANQNSMMKLLIERGADVNRETQAGWKIIESSARAGVKTEIIDYLIAHGAVLDACSAIALGRTEDVRRFTKANLEQLNKCDGQAAVHVAAEYNRLDVLTLLAELAVNLDQPNQENLRALQIACRKGYQEAAIFLVERGCDINFKDDRIGTPIEVAVASGHLDLARALKAKGATHGVKVSIALGDVEAVEKVLAIVDKTDVKSILDVIGPMFRLLCQYDSPLARRLIGFPDVVKSVDEYRRTGFDIAAEYGSINVIQIFLEHRSVTDELNRTSKIPALYRAISKGQLRVVELLLSVTDPNLTYMGRAMLLHTIEFAKKNQLQGHAIVKALLDKGANPLCMDANSDTALHYAATMGDKALTDMLIAKVLNPKNSLGQTPSDIAKVLGHHQLLSSEPVQPVSKSLDVLHGLKIRDVPGRGSCFFYAIERQLAKLNGGESPLTPDQLRGLAVNYAREHQDKIIGFIEGQTPEQYIAAMESSLTWADHIIIQALANALSVNIVILPLAITQVGNPIVIKPATPTTNTVFLGHIPEVHYQSIETFDMTSDALHAALERLHVLGIEIPVTHLNFNAEPAGDLLLAGISHTEQALYSGFEFNLDILKASQNIPLDLANAILKGLTEDLFAYVGSLPYPIFHSPRHEDEPGGDGGGGGAGELAAMPADAGLVMTLGHTNGTLHSIIES